jgi:dCTP deaminase
MTAIAEQAFQPTLFHGPTVEHTTGVYPSQKIESLIADGCITADQGIAADQVQPSSLDLRLGSVAYRVRASLLPGTGATVLEKVEEYTTHQVDLSKPAVLEKGCVYVVPLQEECKLPPRVGAKANPKSSIGRLDVLTRLITDRSTEFERVAPGYRGRLYAEIAPRTFSILVQAGTRVNQIRFVRGTPRPADSDIRRLQAARALLYVEDEAVEEPDIDQGIWISVDLRGLQGSDIVGYKAKAHAPLIDLDRVGYYDPAEFWEPISKPRNGRLILNPSDFYILASRERMWVPPTHAAEMVVYNQSVGEMRIHYAGFFDPGFGYGDENIGTHAVLEVRSHEVPFLLEDEQRVGRLVYERLMAPPDRLYGPAIGSSYQGQSLWLSKQFKKPVSS